MAAALRAMSLQALRDTLRWELLRTPGLVATLIAIAGGYDDAQDEESADSVEDDDEEMHRRRKERLRQDAEARDDRRRLAAKTLAHMGALPIALRWFLTRRICTCVLRKTASLTHQACHYALDRHCI